MKTASSKFTLIWKAPPEDDKNGLMSRESFFDKPARELKKNPNKWALIFHGDDPKYTYSVAFQIRKGMVVASRPAGAFEARVVGKDVYARYIGKAQTQKKIDNSPVPVHMKNNELLHMTDTLNPGARVRSLTHRSPVKNRKDRAQEKHRMKYVLVQHKGNQQEAAKAMDMPLSTFRDRMRYYKLKCSAFNPPRWGEKK